MTNADSCPALPCFATAVEIACNILDRAATPPAAVETRIGELAAAEGAAVKSSYRIGRAPEELLELALQLPDA